MLSDTAPMSTLHVGGSVSVFGGKLIISGGYDENFTLSGVMESYDPGTNIWQRIGHVPKPIFWHRCVSIYRYELQMTYLFIFDVR